MNFRELWASPEDGPKAGRHEVRSVLDGFSKPSQPGDGLSFIGD